MNETLDLLRIRPDQFAERVLAGQGSVFVLFDDQSEVARVLHGVLARAVAEHEGLTGFVADGEAFADLRKEYEEKRHLTDTFHLNELPVIALFRKGALITTFEPWMHYAGKRLWRQDLSGQFETFLQKMVFFDPTKVREQKNLHLEL